jgi:hypothetical protein
MGVLVCVGVYGYLFRDPPTPGREHCLCWGKVDIKKSNLYLSFFSFSQSLSRALQTYHETMTDSDLTELLSSRGPSNSSVHRCSVSHVYKVPGADNNSNFAEGDSHVGFVSVWNSGTSAFDDLLKEYVAEIPWKEMQEKYANMNETDRRRGNYQVTLGYACGQSLTRETTSPSVDAFGAAVPAVRSVPPQQSRHCGKIEDFCEYAGH